MFTTRFLLRSKSYGGRRRWRARSQGRGKIQLRTSVTSNDQREWVVENEPSVTPRKALNFQPLFGRERSYIQSDLDDPIYAAGNPRITSHPKPSGGVPVLHDMQKK